MEMLLPGAVGWKRSRRVFADTTLEIMIPREFRPWKSTPDIEDLSGEKGNIARTLSFWILCPVKFKSRAGRSDYIALKVLCMSRRLVATKPLG
jgi:hypothetical protein